MIDIDYYMNCFHGLLSTLNAVIQDLNLLSEETSEVEDKLERLEKRVEGDE